MNKLITVYDNTNHLNNVVSALTLDADEIFYIYHHNIDKINFENNDKVLRKYKRINTHYIKLKDDKKEINKILHSNKNIIADVGGAKYLSLLLFELASNNNNKLVYFDDEENVIKEYRNHIVLKKRVFKLDTEDVLKLGGGKVKSCMHLPIKDNKTKHLLVKIVERNIDDYPGFVRYINRVNSALNKNNYRGKRTHILNKDTIRNIVSDSYYKKINGLFTIEDNKLIFATEKLREMVCVSGAFLENYLYIKLHESKKFDDIKMSAVVDFSNDKYAAPVRCEIDCLAIKNNKMLFVSCKSSKAETADINEIYVHNHKFGNMLSKPVLCVGEELDRKYPSIYAKAEELGVYIADKSSFINQGIAKTFIDIINDNYVYDELRK